MTILFQSVSYPQVAVDYDSSVNFCGVAGWGIVAVWPLC